MALRNPRRPTIDWITENWLVFLIPVISAVVGWFTNVVAVKMMFHPVDFVGVKPFLGWQGIVPANAIALARTSTDLITTKLINLGQLFENFDADGFSVHMEEAIDEITDQIIAETAAKYAGPMWEGMDENARKAIRAMVRAEVKVVTVKILADMSESIEEILDLTGIVVDQAHRDRALIGQMFQRVGSEEFAFIKRSGAYFGGIFGAVQLGAWITYPAWWVLPVFGFFVGYVTNWVALKLIFEPAEPKKIGPFTIQGLFHKRQQIVAREFATMVSQDVINPDNMVIKMTTGETGDRLFAIIEKRIDELLDKYKTNPMVGSMVPAGEWDTIRAEVMTQIRGEIAKPDGFLHIFTSRAVDVYNELFDRMIALDSASFEGVLRPPFQKDEWKLILAGGVLGMGAGILQVLYLFG
jgi:uncharacterized membrane protein YheB (UPF0754 family)